MPNYIKIIGDLNATAYLMAVGFVCEFVPRTGSTFILDAEFERSAELEQAYADYRANRPVPVQSFVASYRYIRKLIRDHRQQGKGYPS